MKKIKWIHFLLLTALVVVVNCSTANSKTSLKEQPGTHVASSSKDMRIQVLVIPSRNHARMQPQMYYAFKTAGIRHEPKLLMKFSVFNPFLSKYMRNTRETQKKMLGILQDSVKEVVYLKKNNKGEKLFAAILKYIKKRPQSKLAQIYTMIDEYMEDFQFLIIESSDTYGAHPMFYKPDVTEINTDEGATDKDIIDTLIGVFFIDAAMNQNKQIYGTCHGAQIGYIYAGGNLDRLFKYDPAGYNNAKFTKEGTELNNKEVWRISKFLTTSVSGENLTDISGLKSYAMPEMFVPEDKKSIKFKLNKDFTHSLCMVEPIPADIEVFSYHPFSNYKDKLSGKVSEKINADFSIILKNQTIVDGYKNKNMIGTQFHPQYTADSLDTSMIFDYLVDEVYKKQK